MDKNPKFPNIFITVLHIFYIFMIHIKYKTQKICVAGKLNMFYVGEIVPSGSNHNPCKKN